jgi:hypothetical protein
MVVFTFIVNFHQKISFFLKKRNSEETLKKFWEELGSSFKKNKFRKGTEFLKLGQLNSF